MSDSSRKLFQQSGVFLLAGGFGLGLACAALLGFGFTRFREGMEGMESISSSFGPFLHRATADLEDGDFDFLPNRRSVWIVNRSNGRMANYFFHDDETGSVDRSRIATIDSKNFPRKDTVLRLSDRNLNNILWVCNVRTGDVQMWHLGRDGVLRGETPIASSTDLMDRTAPKE